MSTDKINYEKIEDEIKKLYDKNTELLKRIKEIQKEYDNNYRHIERIMKGYPKCYSCSRNVNPKYMEIATQEDIDNYVDSNDGYIGPEIGEYYCGC